MSKLESIRAVLQEQRHAIITESHVTVFPFQKVAETCGPDRTWTHAVTFGIAPRRGMDRQELNRFMKQIVDLCEVPTSAAFYRSFSDAGYGRARYWEEIGTVTEQRTTTIRIHDADVRLTDKFVDGAWKHSPEAKEEPLYREIVLSFCPYNWLCMMVHDVTDRGAAWIHEPPPEQLERLIASRRR